jgi:hypothetical protein
MTARSQRIFSVSSTPAAQPGNLGGVPALTEFQTERDLGHLVSDDRLRFRIQKFRLISSWTHVYPADLVRQIKYLFFYMSFPPFTYS